MRSLPLLLIAAALASCTSSASTPGSAALPWPLLDETWRTDAAWYDGQAEKCVYEATRTIYGVARTYEAVAYANKQRMDLETTTKAAGSGGLEVFKHHWSERVPTEAYDYDFSTATFTGAADLSPYKLTAATQEDCGASFKQLWLAGREYRWLESVYFPGAGLREGSFTRRDFQLFDGLTLLLRDYPFTEAQPGDEVELRLLRGQRDTHSVGFDVDTHTLRYFGRDVLELPIGRVDTFHLRLQDRSGQRVADYWFAADGSAPWLHALVRYDGPNGVTYRLKSLERTAYWER